MKLGITSIICAALLISALSACKAEESRNTEYNNKKTTSSVFTIGTANLNGDGLRTIYSDSYRQATHIRVSPDGRWIMFSRYNDKDPKDGLAKENWGGGNHYANTELLLMRSDGSGLRTIVAPKKGIMAVNSNWTDDGKGFVFVSTDNKKKIPEIRRAYFTPSMEISRFETISLPKQLIPVDPHLWRGKLVFPAVDLRDMVRGLWISNEDGSKVAFMRLVEGHSLWEIYVVDVATGGETNLSDRYLSKHQMDAVPEWSGDGQRIIFWSVDINKVAFKITSMRPDGTGRLTFPSDDDVFYQSPAFFPGTGSGQNAKIAFSTWRVAKWKLNVRRLFTK